MASVIKWIGWHGAKAIPYAIGGMLASMVSLVLLLVILYPHWLNGHQTFGPDNDPWIVFMCTAVLPVMLVAGAIGAFGGFSLFVWRMRRFQRQFECEARLGGTPQPGNSFRGE
jgi:ABC-type Na+ efflux pump permease subunit